MADYVTSAQLLNHYRVTTVAQLCNDDGVTDSRVELLTNTKLTTAITAASGAIESALVVGKRYSTEELEGLTGNSAAHLQKICADIAMTYLYERNPVHDIDTAAKFRDLSERHLENLRKGINIFNLDAAKDHTVVTLDGPTSVDYHRMNTIPDRTRNYYPSRERRLPTDRG